MASKETSKKESKTYTIDAEGKILGRLATHIASVLRGKNTPYFAPHKDPCYTVVVKNVDKIKITGNKINNKIYYRYSGYIGGLKETKLKDLFDKKPSEVLKKAVYGMLPKNRLRKHLIKRLRFE